MLAIGIPVSSFTTDCGRLGHAGSTNLLTRRGSITLTLRIRRRLVGIETIAHLDTPVLEPLGYPPNPLQRPSMLPEHRDDVALDTSLPTPSITSEVDPLQTGRSTSYLRSSDDDDEPPNGMPRPNRLHSFSSHRFPRTTSILTSIAHWIHGPSPAHILRPTPLLDRRYTVKRLSLSFSLSLESTWIRLTRRFTKLPFFIACVVAYIIAFSFIVRANWFLTPSSAFTGCTDAYWVAKDGCGVDGQYCLPFNGTGPQEFRCPAQCSSTRLLNIRTVGDEVVVYQPLVVGGGDSEQTFRGDSWICAAAIQTGAISNSKGGCASVQLIGTFPSFTSTLAHGIPSISFPAPFPLSYRILPSTTLTHCTDLRSSALTFNILITTLLLLILRPKPLIVFWSLVCIGFWHITFFSDPRGEPPPISDAFGAFLPASFVAYAFWQHAFKWVLPAFDAQPIERWVLYSLGFWVGTLFNVVTDKIPVDRLLVSDIKARPGALTAVITIALLLTLIVLNQIRVIRKSGWLPHYLACYVTGGLVIVVLASLPGLRFRVHHYFVGIVLMPGTAFPTRVSAVYQAFLLGMFLDGVARWGFDSILQTAAELQRDAPLGTSLPAFLASEENPLMNLSSTLVWRSMDAANVTDEGWTGYSLLVDDVQRYSGAALNFSLQSLGLLAGVPHFFRLAYSRDGTSGDFTQAAVFYPNGTFTDPPPGPS